MEDHSGCGSSLTRGLDNPAIAAVRSMNPLPGWARVIRLLARPLATVTLWLTATGFFGVAFFLSGGRRARVEEAITFAVAFAGAAAVSTVIVLAIGAKENAGP